MKETIKSLIQNQLLNLAGACTGYFCWSVIPCDGALTQFDGEID